MKSIITKHPSNPILVKDQIPYKSDLVFNAGVAKFEGKYVMIFRNDYGYDGKCFEGTSLGLAFSEDGVTWEVENNSIFHIEDPEVDRIYDPRITILEDRCYVCFAMDTKHGLRGGIAITEDFYNYEILHLTVPDNRNMVLFPEKMNGMYMRLERPFPVYSRWGSERFDIWLSESPDLRFWGNSKLVLGVEDVPFSNYKIGPGAPPIKTTKGWLTTFHAVDFDASRGKNGWEPTWKKRYTAGIMLLDSNNPSKVVGICKEPLLFPEESYEINGFRNHVIFPGGMILEDSGEVKIYYGAADTVECLATAHVDDLIKLCL